jgi:hypothetical protein
MFQPRDLAASPGTEENGLTQKTICRFGKQRPVGASVPSSVVLAKPWGSIPHAHEHMSFHMILLQREALRKISVMHMHMQDLLKLCALKMIEYRQMAGRLQAVRLSLSQCLGFDLLTTDFFFWNPDNNITIK